MKLYKSSGRQYAMKVVELLHFDYFGIGAVRNSTKVVTYFLGLGQERFSRMLETEVCLTEDVRIEESKNVKLSLFYRWWTVEIVKRQVMICTSQKEI